MDSLQMEELPYVVWYQCRMCTHVFLDDIEKILAHLEQRHSAMIDCEEVRGVIYKNGLKMGGLSGPKLKTDEVERIEEGDEESQILTHPQQYAENENGFGDNEMMLVAVDDVNNDGYMNNNGDYDEDVYEESDYQDHSIEVGEMKFTINDAEEQLPEDDPDDNAYDEEGDQEDMNNGENFDVLSQERLNDSFEGEEEDYNGEFYDESQAEEGEIISSEEQAFNGEDDDDEEQVCEEEPEIQISTQIRTSKRNINKNGNGVQNYRVGSNQQKNLLNGFGYSCKFCKKFFTTRRGVETHEQHHKTQSAPTSTVTRRSNNEPRVYPCKLCKNKYFHSFKDLKAHVKNHTPERIHICKFCCATFTNTASLTKHLTIHKRENPNKCFCGKTFVSANTLKIHKKIHTGIKPFVCNFHHCGRAFVTKSTLESHLRTHTGEKPYSCGYCSSSFTTSSAKYRHERHVHKIQDSHVID